MVARHSSSAQLDLEADGVRMPWIISLVLSPTFAADGTLFAYAKGAAFGTTARGSVRGFPHGAVFRSTDRGESWEVVLIPEPLSVSASRNGLDPEPSFGLVMAPDYATNGLIVGTWGSAVSGRNPAIRGCGRIESRDFGQTWSSQGSLYVGCPPTWFTGGSTPRVISGSDADNQVARWRVRRIGAEQWTGIALAAPEVRSSTYQDLRRIRTPRDGTIFFGEINGLWALGDSVRASFARLPCVTEDSPSLAAAIAAAPRSRVYLGCPIAPPRTVELKERRLGETVDVWIEGFGKHWYSISPRDPSAPSQLAMVVRLDKAGRPWTGVPDRTTQAELQEYEGGIVVRSTGAALFLSTAGWEEIPLPMTTEE